MKFYWGLNSIPELQGLPIAQQRHMWNRATRQGWRMPRVWASQSLFLLLCAVMMIFIYQGGLRGVPEPLQPILAIGMGLLIFVIPYQFLVHTLRPVLAIYRRTVEPKSPHDDGSYHVPPAF